jgi:hypothetical protein
LTDDKPAPQPSEAETHANEGYRALGRWIAEFSRMISVMRDLMVQRLKKAGDPLELAELAFNGATAGPITDAFFGMCRLLTEHDTDEEQAARKLRESVLDQITLRNTVAHGDWYIGYWSTTGGAEPGQETVEPDAPWVERIIAGRKAGPRRSVKENLDEHSDELARLRTLLRQYGTLCFRLHPRAKRVRDVLVIENGKPEFGALANTGPWMV